MAYSLPDMIWFISISRGLDCFRPAYSFFFFLFFFGHDYVRPAAFFFPYSITSDLSLPSGLDYVRPVSSFSSRLRHTDSFLSVSITSEVSLPS